MPLEQSWRELSAFPEDRETVEPNFDHLFEQVNPQYPVAASVQALEERCRALSELAGEILTTLRLDGNVHLFAEFPEDWHDFVSLWQKQYEQIMSVDMGKGPVR